jgi:hypothetical protein
MFAFNAILNTTLLQILVFCVVRVSFIIYLGISFCDDCNENQINGATCILCKTNYGLVNNICQTCSDIQSCQACSLDTLNNLICLRCASGYIVSQNKCLPCQINKCTDCRVN